MDNGSGVLACSENLVDVLAEGSVVNQASAVGEAVFADQGGDFGLGEADAEGAKAGAEL